MTDVWKLYDEFAERFDSDRGRDLGEIKYLSEVASRLAPGASVLDLGCGGGEPIARFFLDRGFALSGVDAEPAMIALCRARFRGATWIVEDMRRIALGRRFHAIIAWDSFFHLNADDQRAMFPLFRDHVVAGGVLLFTSGSDAGEAIGKLYGQPLFHASLSVEEYRQLLAGHGFSVIAHSVEDPDCGGHTVWFAQCMGGDGIRHAEDR